MEKAKESMQDTNVAKHTLAIQSYHQLMNEVHTVTLNLLKVENASLRGEMAMQLLSHSIAFERCVRMLSMHDADAFEKYNIYSNEMREVLNYFTKWGLNK